MATEATAEDLIRKAFHELRARIEAIEAQTAPLVAQRDAIHAQARALELTSAPLIEQIRAIEQDNQLYEKKLDLAKLSRALGGKTARE